MIWLNDCICVDTSGHVHAGGDFRHGMIGYHRTALSETETRWGGFAKTTIQLIDDSPVNICFKKRFVLNYIIILHTLQTHLLYI